MIVCKILSGKFNSYQSLLFAFCSNYFEPSLIKRFDAREEKIILLSYLYDSFEK
jgi:hypothetical protein